VIHFVTPLKRTVSSRSFISSGRDSYCSNYKRKSRYGGKQWSGGCGGKWRAPASRFPFQWESI